MQSPEKLETQGKTYRHLTGVTYAEIIAQNQNNRTNQVKDEKTATSLK